VTRPGASKTNIACHQIPNGRRRLLKPNTVISVIMLAIIMLGKVWRYQRSNQNPYIEEEQTTQLPKEKSTKGQTTIYKTYIYNLRSSNTNPTKNWG